LFSAKTSCSQLIDGSGSTPSLKHCGTGTNGAHQHYRVSMW